VSERLLTVGQLARRAGVATSALRYWDELGVLPARARISGQRRYPESAVAMVGVILLLRDAGFSLAEQKALRVFSDVTRRCSSIPRSTGLSARRRSTQSGTVGGTKSPEPSCPAAGRFWAA
jgi:MerR-like DNA binding protein